MRVIPHGALHRSSSDACNIDIPAVDYVTFGFIDKESLLVGSPVHYLQLRKLYAFFVPGCSGYARYHHKLHQLLSFESKLSPLCFFETVFGRGYVLARKGFEELRCVKY